MKTPKQGPCNVTVETMDGKHHLFADCPHRPDEHNGNFVVIEDKAGDDHFYALVNVVAVHIEAVKP